jgi:hypothetical protein
MTILQTEQITASGGWVTKRKKDRSQTLCDPFYSTNPMYVAQHKEWDWQECDYAVAVARLAVATSQ